LSASKRRALDQLLPRFAVAAGEPVDALDLGCGSGETALALAAERPEWVVLAVDVHAASIATLARRAATARLDNLRIELDDGVELLRHLIPPGSLQLLRALFPDPWPKARQRHRRLVQAPFAALTVDRLASGGALELATDLADYAVQMTKVLGAEPLLQGGPGRRFEHPVTFYEERAVSAHRLVHHLRYVRLPEPDRALQHR
jgi:tRNA (guanine-N7-)-methyltransferase